MADDSIEIAPEPADQLPEDGEPPEIDLATYPRGDGNLVAFFSQSEEGKAFLKKLAEQVCEEKDTAWDSSEEWRERVASNNRIITGFLKKKSLPFEGCANAHMPVALERLLRLTSNVFVEIFLERDTIFGVKPTGPDDYEDAEALTLHGTWQIRNELTDFIRQQHRGLWDFFAVGSVFAHSWYDDVKRRNRHDILTCDEFYMPYVWVTREADLSDVPYKGRIVRKYRHELEELRDTEKWSNVDEVLKKAPPAWSFIETKGREEGGKREGIVAPENDKRAPYLFYEHHGYAKMPGDVRLQPICATVDAVSKTVMKLYLNLQEDWQDRARFDAQTKEMETYQQDRQAHEETASMQMQLQEAMANPEIDPADAQIMAEGMAQDEPLEPPMPPSWLEGRPDGQPEPVRMVPIEQFSHGACVENMFGALGLSFGTIEVDLNKLIDESLNRFYDSATLANCWGIITPEAMDLGGTQIPWGPGKQIKVKNFNGDQLKNNILELKPAPANPQLLEIVRIAEAAADSSIAAPSVLSGEPGKSGETFRGLATRVEKATRQLSAAGIKYLDFFENILKNNARLNSLFMPEVQVIQVLDHMDLPSFLSPPGAPPPVPGRMREVTVGRDMYRRNYSVTFTADVRFASQAQRISEADELVALTQHPALMSNASFNYLAIRKALQARGQHEMIQALGPPPPPPTMPMTPGMPPPMAGPPGAAPPGDIPPGEPPPPDGGEGLPPEAQGPVQGPPPQEAMA